MTSANHNLLTAALSLLPNDKLALYNTNGDMSKAVNQLKSRADKSIVVDNSLQTGASQNENRPNVDFAIDAFRPLSYIQSDEIIQKEQFHLYSILVAVNNMFLYGINDQAMDALLAQLSSLREMYIVAVRNALSVTNNNPNIKRELKEAILRVTQLPEKHSFEQHLAHYIMLERFRVCASGEARNSLSSLNPYLQSNKINILTAIANKACRQSAVDLIMRSLNSESIDDFSILCRDEIFRLFINKSKATDLKQLMNASSYIKDATIQWICRHDLRDIWLKSYMRKLGQELISLHFGKWLSMNKRGQDDYALTQGHLAYLMSKDDANHVMLIDISLELNEKVFRKLKLYLSNTLSYDIMHYDRHNMAILVTAISDAVSRYNLSLGYDCLVIGSRFQGFMNAGHRLFGGRTFVLSEQSIDICDANHVANRNS